MSARSVVVNAQRRFHGRRRRVPAMALVAGLTVVALAVGGWFTINSSLFDVRAVTVEGTSRLTPAQVLAAARVTGGGSLFLLDASSIEQRVRRLPPVASVSVTRHWPHDVVIRVVERQPAAVVVGPGEAMLLDATGVPFAPAASAQDGGKGLVEVQVDAPVPGAGERDARAAMQVLGQLPDPLRARVARLEAPSPSQVRMQLRDGRTVVWGSPTDNATKLAVLRTLLRRDARFYDVSTPDVVVTR